MECGLWAETFDFWHKRGLPDDVNDNWKAARHFGFWRLNQEWVAENLGLLPPFEEKVLRCDERYKTIVDVDDATEKFRPYR